MSWIGFGYERMAIVRQSLARQLSILQVDAPVCSVQCAVCGHEYMATLAQSGEAHECVVDDGGRARLILLQTGRTLVYGADL